MQVAEVEDRWYSPGETYFRVRVESGERYVLKRTEAQDVWSLEGYQKAANLSATGSLTEKIRRRIVGVSHPRAK